MSLSGMLNEPLPVFFSDIHFCFPMKRSSISIPKWVCFRRTSLIYSSDAKVFGWFEPASFEPILPLSYGCIVDRSENLLAKLIVTLPSSLLSSLSVSSRLLSWKNSEFLFKMINLWTQNSRSDFIPIDEHSSIIKSISPLHRFWAVFSLNLHPMKALVLMNFFFSFLSVFKLPLFAFGRLKLLNCFKIACLFSSWIWYSAALPASW